MLSASEAQRLSPEPGRRGGGPLRPPRASILPPGRPLTRSLWPPRDEPMPGTSPAPRIGAQGSGSPVSCLHRGGRPSSELLTLSCFCGWAGLGKHSQRGQGRRAMACRAGPAHCLLVSVKLYWNAAPSSYAHSLWQLHGPWHSRGAATEAVWVAKPELCSAWVLWPRSWAGEPGALGLRNSSGCCGWATARQRESESTGHAAGAGTLCPWLAASASTLVTG